MKNPVLDCLTRHRSIRSYTSEPVSETDLASIMDAVQAAPNWVNLQLVSVVAVRCEKSRERIAHLCGNQPHIAAAPVFLVFWPAGKRDRTLIWSCVIWTLSLWAPTKQA